MVCPRCMRNVKVRRRLVAGRRKAFCLEGNHFIPNKLKRIGTVIVCGANEALPILSVVPYSQAPNWED